MPSKAVADILRGDDSWCSRKRVATGRDTGFTKSIMRAVTNETGALKVYEWKDPWRGIGSPLVRIMKGSMSMMMLETRKVGRSRY